MNFLCYNLNMKKLSVIVCVYNTDETLFEACLNSIFNSTIKDLEVIIVDDGSSKDYSSILNKFDVKYFKTENKGTLNARIFGVKQTSSPYVCFVDSDDTISFNYLEGSLKSIQDSDIIINDWAFNTHSTMYYCFNDSTINSNFVCYEPTKRFFAQQGKEHSTYVLWNKIFKREVILSACEEVEKLNIDRMVYAEDVLITYFAFSLATKVSNTHVGYYFYRVHDTQEVAVESKDKHISHVISLTDVFNFIENDLKSKKMFEIVREDFLAWKQFLCSINYSVAKKYKSKELNEFIKQRYVNCELKTADFMSDYPYLNQKLLPKNIDEIDELLKRVYYSNKCLKICVRKNSYAYKELIKMQKVFKTRFVFAKGKESDIIFPKEIISLKQKILHNTFVFKIGVLLFPKGSKIRSVLKSKL